MASHSNHHFVPQFYFRNFSSDSRRINVLNKKAGRIILGASIRHQCARRKFYVAKEVESAFAKLETDQSRSIRRVLALAEKGASTEIDTPTFLDLCRTVLFQRARTVHEAEKHAPAHEQMQLDWFKIHLLNKGEDEMHDKLVEADRLGQVRVTADRRQVVALLLSLLSTQAKMILDLEMRILRNLTDYPFIFGDAPVIFYNSHLRKITDRGVLGLQQPGLEIFCPLSSRVCLLLFDHAKYRGRILDEFVVDISSRSDVSQLNALQLHSSWENAYFERREDETYVHELWLTHRHTCIPVTARYIHRWVTIGRDPTPQEILHYYEPQLPYELDLSFIESDPIQPKDFRWEYRRPELLEIAERERFEMKHGLLT